MSIFDQIKQQLEGNKKTIVFPEGIDPRVLGACKRLHDEGLMNVVVLGDTQRIEATAKEIGISLDGMTHYDPANYEDMDVLADAFVERRKGKIDKEKALDLLKNDVNYFGTLLVHTEKADGLVSGAMHATSDTVRPALQVIKMQEEYSKTSGLFVMVKGDEKLIMSDCAITIAPDANDLAENAIISAKTAKSFGIDPKVAMLSFSTKGSAESDETKRVEEATRIAKEKAPDLVIDGELQFDAAYVPSVGESKAKGSPVAGHANVFVFPSLEAGNIGYKIAQRLGGFEAIGPILQGLNKPVNDLSRGCNEEDVYKLALITAVQAID